MAWLGSARRGEVKNLKDNRMSMIYQWKHSHPVPAQIAGEELERIENKYGELSPQKVLDESRSENAVLHSCFEWNNDVAAEKYRLSQAHDLIRHITVKVIQKEQEEPTQIRAFVNTSPNPTQREPFPGTYISVSKAMSDEATRRQVLLNAWSELQAFSRKYSNLSELKPIFDVIENLSCTIFKNKSVCETMVE